MASSMHSCDIMVQFHSLKGTTIGEKRKNLFFLLQQISENKSVIDFKQLRPKSPLEEKFKIEALIHFNNTEGLFFELSNGNPVIVQLIIKKGAPLLVQALHDMTTKQLLSILSKISLNAKLKLLNKCGQYFSNSNKAEEFFKAVREKYGIHLAAKFLTVCSSEFVVDFVKSTYFKFTSNQLLVLVKKYPEIVLRLFEIMNKRVNVANKYKSVYQYLANHNVPLFISLRKIYDSTLHMGWRTTNNFIKHDKDEIINNAEIYNKILKMKYIRKSLQGDDYNKFFYGLFPPLRSQFDNVYDKLLSLAPSLQVLLKGFCNMYNIELLDEPKLINPKLLEMMSNEERVKILKAEYKPTDFTDDQWVCYLSITEAITLLKKQISLTSDIQGRVILVGLLVDACRINKDKIVLLEICNYMVKQHRNDHITVRVGFLKAIKKRFKFENLGPEHWIPIRELVRIFELNGECFYYNESFSLGYLESCIKNKLPIKDALITCLKSTGNRNLLSEKPSYEKICLQATAGILPDLGEDLVSNSIDYFNALINWNKRHPNDAYLVYESLNFVEILKEGMKKEDSSWIQTYTDNLMWYVFKSKTFAKRNVLMEFYIQKMKTTKIMWLIHCDLSFLLNNLDICMSTILKSGVRTDSLWRYMKLYSHLEIPQKIVDVCSHKLAHEISDKKQLENVMTALSFLMPIANFTNLSYKVGPYLKNITPNVIVLEIVLLYIKSNRLSLAKRTIFSLMNNLKEEYLLQLIIQLLETDNPDAHKVALHILFRTMQNEKIIETLKTIIANEKNVILNKFILLKIFKYFVKNPSNYIWCIIKLSVSALDVDDIETYNLVIQPHIVPDEYLVHYVLFMWPIVEKLPRFYQDYGVKLLQVSEPHLLPQKFCEDLIEKYFFCYFKNYTAFYVHLQAFVSKYICGSPKTIEKHVNKVLTASGNKTNLKLRSYVNHFVRQLCYECIKQNKNDVLLKFADLWSASHMPYEFFYEYLHIQLSLIKIEKADLPEVANRIVHLCTSLIDTYGTEFLYPFSQHIKEFCMSNLVKGNTDEETEFNLYALVEGIAKSNELASLLLAILLLENHYPCFIEGKAKYDSLMAIFENRSEPEIGMFLTDFIQTRNE